MFNLHKILINKKTLNFSLNNVRCDQHKTRIEECNIIVNKQKFKTTTIYDKCHNYEVENYETYCEDIPCRKYTILQIGTILSSHDLNNFITVDNKNIFKINTRYITEELLFFFNDSTINGNAKMIGM